MTVQAPRAVTHFLVRSKRNPSLILTVSGEFMPESLCGPGNAYSAKIYKTRRGAEAVGTDESRTVHACTAQGIEPSRVS